MTIIQKHGKILAGRWTSTQIILLHMPQGPIPRSSHFGVRTHSRILARPKLM